MKNFLLTNVFIFSLSTQFLYSMSNKIQQDQKLLQKKLENFEQVINSNQKVIEDYRQKFIVLEEQIEANKKREQEALKKQHDIRMFNWIVGSGIGIVILGCIFYSYWENKALKNAQRYRRIKY